MTSKTDEKSKVKYESEIITSKETFENPLDISKIPVFTIENCEVLNSSLGSATPKFGHNIQILLPVDTNFVAQDKSIRTNYLISAQKDDPNLEFVKGSINTITKKDVLEGKYEEKYQNRAFVNINISNSCMFDKTLGEDGKDSYKKIDNAKDAIGEAVVKYFRVIDQWTGEGVDPDVFKYVNGEKVKSFTNPKTKQESPFYVGRGDLVNIKLRPYGTKNKKTGDLSLRYNLLSVEIVQTAWDRGIGRKAGTSRVHEAPDSVNANALDDIFGGIAVASGVAQQPAPQPVQQTPAPTQEVAQPAQPAQTTPVAEKKTEPVAETSNEVPTLDFSALANMDLGSVNLGE